MSHSKVEEKPVFRILPSFNDGNNTKMANARTAEARTIASSLLNDSPDNNAII